MTGRDACPTSSNIKLFSGITIAVAADGLEGDQK
jgi:hypothetical protein